LPHRTRRESRESPATDSPSAVVRAAPARGCAGSKRSRSARVERYKRAAPRDMLRRRASS
jgi:hypothetical protein